MRDKFIKKLAIVGLAAIFLLSMSSYGPAQKGGKGGKGKEPPELYKVTISINDEGKDGLVPGIETVDLQTKFPPCVSRGYFYAEKEKGGENLLLSILSKGSDTPGHGGEVAPLNMNVVTGKSETSDYPIELEKCFFEDGCHGETGYYTGQIFFRFPKGYDGPDPNEDINIRWWLDYTKVEFDKGKKKSGRGWVIYSLTYEEGTYLDQYVISTNPYPPIGMEVGDDPWETDVIGPFVLIHDGKACYGPEDMYNRVVLPGFNIHLTIERVR